MGTVLPRPHNCELLAIRLLTFDKEREEEEEEFSRYKRSLNNGCLEIHVAVCCVCDLGRRRQVDGNLKIWSERFLEAEECSRGSCCPAA